MPKISCQGVQMYYEFQGTAIPVVMVSVLSGDHLDWALQAPALAAAGYRCLLFDNRDAGQTDESPIASYECVYDDRGRGPRHGRLHASAHACALEREGGCRPDEQER